MKAVVTKTFGNPPEMTVEERPKPTFKKGFSLVRMHSATINPFSNFLRRGELGTAQAPLVLGNEGSGMVEESGRFKSGTRVAIFGGGTLGVTQDGLFQQWALVEDKRLVELPDTLDWDEGAALTVNYLTALGALKRSAKLQSGQTVLVSGATGGVGHALMEATQALGGHPIALVSSPEKALRAKEAGAESVIDLSAENLVEAVQRLTDGRGADIAMDPVGGRLAGQMLRALAHRGRLVSIGFTAGKEAQIDLVNVVVHEKSAVGFSVNFDSDEDLASALDELAALTAKGLLKPVIDSAYAIEDFERGYSRLTSRQAVGSVILHL
ncbi:zinc-binding dehydrogenase [Pseudogulbenkiania sp. MAI-1]|uniref:quinone oxidoreductase family protein n=1 Tax=Pseudogulbenkiania sp. MAI-1 TaxID=990370 RepID=UPI0004A46E0C|nr:zinc-binding dehydrogenase [Pseudogulbenkiania sp. MAI-1]